MMDNYHENMTKEEYDAQFVIEDEEKICEKISNLKLSTSFNVMGIDIGIQHLGISLSEVDENFNFVCVKDITLIDIQKFNCENPSTCRFSHSKSFADWMSHVFYNYYELFDSAKVILIERQPPNGLTAIEQIIYLILRERAVLIHPRSVHSYFHMGNDYELRKEDSVKIAEKFLPPELKEKLKTYDRAHDITDSILFTLYWCDQKKKELEITRLQKRQQKALEKYNKNIGGKKEFYEAFRYVPSLPRIE